MSFDNSEMDKNAERDKYDRIRDQIYSLLKRKSELTEEEKRELAKLTLELNAMEKENGGEKFTHAMPDSNSMIFGGEVEIYEFLKKVKQKAEEGDPNAIKAWERCKVMYSDIIGSWIDRRGNN